MNETPETASQVLPLSSHLEVIEGLRYHQHAEWQSGQPMLVEQLLEQYASGVSLNDDQMLELILAEWLLAKSHGQIVRLEAYERRFPNFATRLNRLFSLASALDHTSLSKTTSLAQLTDLLTKTLWDSRNTTPATATPVTSLQSGMLIGKYRLRERLGQGGMGVVYLASHTMIDHLVAIKVMQPQQVQHSSSQSRFLKEAQICVSLEHANLVRTFNIDQDGPFLFMTMELLNGCNLAEQVTLHGPLSSDTVYKIVAQAAEGLSYAHRKGIIHRDVKPHNIMLAQDGGVKVLDLGLASLKDELQEPHPEDNIDERVFNQRLTATGSVMGTVAYMAPEQARNPQDADARSDLYSLGCTAYFLLTGESIHGQATPLDVLKDKLSRDEWTRLSLSATPAIWQKLLTQMVAWKAEDRFQSMDALLVELDRLFGEGEVWMPDARDLETLRSKLLHYDLITEPQWFQAQMAMVDNSSSFSTMAFRPDVTSSPTPVFELLFKMSDSSSDYEPCLTQFQVQQIMAGQISRLRLPEHVILDSINNGWKGEVFRCRRVDTQRVEAVRVIGQQKLLGLGRTATEVFAASVVALKNLTRLDYPGIAKSFGGSWYEEKLLVAVEHVPGTPLSSEVRSCGGYKNQDDWKALLETAIAMAESVEYLHSQGILHLDLSTERWIRSTDRSLRLLDAGLASLLLPKQWSDIPASSGMPPIVAPEMLGDLSAASPAADVYALGHVFRFLRSCEFPFKSMKLSDLPSRSHVRLRKHRSNVPAGGLLDKSQDEQPLTSAALRRSPSEATAFNWQSEFDELTARMTLADNHKRIQSTDSLVVQLKRLLATQEAITKPISRERSSSLVARLRGFMGR